MTVLIHLPFAIPEARYGGYQMTAYPIISIASAHFLTSKIKSAKLIITIILIFSFLNVYIVYTERTFYRELKETYVQLNDDLKDNSVLIVYQAVKPIKNIYSPNLQIYNIFSDYQNELAKITGYVPVDLTEIINKNDTLYILESGVVMPDDHLKLLFRQFTKDQGAKVKGFALEKILVINPDLVVEKLEGYALDVYRLTKLKDK